MSWGDLLDNLAGAVGGAKRPSAGAARPVARVERMEPEEDIEIYDAARIADIERQTRAEMERAARETSREISRAELATYGDRVGRAESRVLDIESGVGAKLDELTRAVRGLEADRDALARIERRLNWLLGLGVMLVLVILGVALVLRP